MDSGEAVESEGSPWGNAGHGIEEEKKSHSKVEKKNNILPLWGNERTMNLNPLILTNIQSSHYFKVNLYELKTYHEVIDEIYFKVNHLEPWEKGSRKTAGQTGMCGGVRGVGAGGIVSTAYCLLYKLFTLKLTRKQVNGLLTHPDSPYIRGLGFMYIRYTQPPADLWDWYEPYLEDPEVVDVKAGGGQSMTIGEMLRAFLTKLEWFSTLFPRIPVPIQQKLEKKMSERFPPVTPAVRQPKPLPPPVSSSKEARHIPDDEVSFGEAERFSRLRRADGVGGTAAALPGRGAERDRRAPERRDKRERTPPPRHRSPPPRRDRSPVQRYRERSRSPLHHKDKERSPAVHYRSKERSPAMRYRSKERSPAIRYRSKERSPAIRYRSKERSPAIRYRSKERSPAIRYRSKERSPPRYRERSREREYRHKPREPRETSSGHRYRSPDDFADELRREKERQKREKEKERERYKEREKPRSHKHSRS